VLGFLLSAVFGAVGMYGRSPEEVLSLFLVATAGIGMCEGAFWTAAVRIGGPRGAIAAGIMNTGGNAGGMLSPTLTPVISKQIGWEAALGVSSGVCVVGAVLWFWVDASGQTEQASERQAGEALGGPPGGPPGGP
jgi:ACS family glucarate transporter-like MFS transporter